MVAPVYSADLQGTAGKAAIFGERLRKPPSDVAVLADFHRRHGLGLAMYSAQNIDRLVTFFRVSPQSDRFLVLHLYTTSVAAVIVQRELPDGAVQHRLPTARRSAVARVWPGLGGVETARGQTYEHPATYPQAPERCASRF